MDFYLHAQRAAKPMAVNALQAFCVNSAQPQCVNMSTNNYLTIQNQTKWITSRKPAPLPLCRSNRNNRRTLSQEPRQMASSKYSGKPFNLQDQFELPSLSPPGVYPGVRALASAYAGRQLNPNKPFLQKKSK